MAYRTRLQFRKVSSINDPVSGDVAFYVNQDGDLVKVESDGTETVVGVGGGETVAAHETEFDHDTFLTAST